MVSYSLWSWLVLIFLVFWVREAFVPVALPAFLPGLDGGTNGTKWSRWLYYMYNIHIYVQSHARFFWELIFLAMLQRALSRSKASFSSVFPWNCLTWSRSLSSPSHSEIIERLFRYTRGRWLYNKCELEYITLSPDIYKNTLQILRIILWQCRKWHTLYSFPS